MLARALRLVFGCEVAIYLAIGYWLLAERGWTATAGAGILVAIAVGWRFLLVLGTYALAWAYRSKVPAEHRLSPFALLPHVLREFGAMVAVYGLLQPFERLFMDDPEPPHKRAERPPILLVHGYVCNRASCWRLTRRLRARRETVWAVTLEPVFGSIETAARALARQIEAFVAATDAEQLIIVAHSMGGLAARAYLRESGGAKVKRLITLGSPHRGSVHAQVGAGTNAREMEPGSPWLAALAAAEASGISVPFTSIMSYHDNFIAPQTSAQHPGARIVPLAGVGHLTMLFSRRVSELIEREIDEANASQPESARTARRA